IVSLAIRFNNHSKCVWLLFHKINNSKKSRNSKRWLKNQEKEKPTQLASRVGVVHLRLVKKSRSYHNQRKSWVPGPSQHFLKCDWGFNPTQSIALVDRPEGYPEPKKT